MITLIEAAPLTLFLMFLRHIDTSVPDDWRLPFIAGGLAASAAVGVFIWRKMIFNRILLGINLYLISGGLAFVTRQWWLNRFYDRLGASGMLVWIVAVGAVSLLFSTRGFVGAANGAPNLVRKYSLYLLMLSLCAFGLS